MEMLTEKQKRLCEFVRDFTRNRGFPPTVREIGEHLGLRSPSTVQYHLKRLQEMGVLRLEGGKTRSVTLVEDALMDAGLPQEGYIPLVGNVAAGAPILAEEYIEDYIPFDPGPHPEEYFALRVRGESMLDAGILPGDLVVVHAQPQAENGQIVVALFEDEATVKVLSRRNGEIWLLPRNPLYEPIDGRAAHIVGRVVGLVRRY